MQIMKCDICKKTIEDARTSVHVGLGNAFSNHVEICDDCGASVKDLLRKNNLVKSEIKKDGQ